MNLETSCDLGEGLYRAMTPRQCRYEGGLECPYAQRKAPGAKPDLLYGHPPYLRCRE